MQMSFAHVASSMLSSDPRMPPMRAQNMSSLSLTSSFQVFSSHDTASAKVPVGPAEFG